MGTFDEAKNLFPVPKPDHRPDKPKDKPQPLRLGRAVQFNGVVGRSSLPIATTLPNPNDKHVQLDVKTSGTECRTSSFAEELDEVQAGDNTGTRGTEGVDEGSTRGIS